MMDERKVVGAIKKKTCESRGLTAKNDDLARHLATYTSSR